MKLTEQERAELKAELMAEIKEELAADSAVRGANFALKPTLDKWFNGKELSADRRNKKHNGPLVEIFGNGVVAYRVWDQVRMLTCRVMGVSYVRQITDDGLANETANAICQVLYDQRKKVNDEAHH